MTILHFTNALTKSELRNMVPPYSARPSDTNPNPIYHPNAKLRWFVNPTNNQIRNLRFNNSMIVFHGCEVPDVAVQTAKAYNRPTVNINTSNPLWQTMVGWEVNDRLNPIE